MSVSTATDFYEQLQSSGLLTAEELADLHDEIRANRSLSANRLADTLIERGLITLWQARQMLTGRHAFFVGKYKLLDRLGTGGMGTVFKAHHAMTDRVVALKLVNKSLLANAPAVARFRTEVRLICSLNHPNIITAYDADSVGDMHFLVMEFGQGRDLRSWLKEFGPLPVDWACDCIRQAALALDHAHQRGLVHRDIKPENILVEGADPTTPPKIKLLDMGLARLMNEEPAEDAELAGKGKLMGTPDYISPEQATHAANADIRSDIYSLGATFFKILTDEVPFDGGDVRQRLMSRLLGDAPRVSSRRDDVYEEVDNIVARMLAREPDDRYQTPAELAEALFPFTFQGEKVAAGLIQEADEEDDDGEPAEADALRDFFSRMAAENDTVSDPRANSTATVSQPSAVQPLSAVLPLDTARSEKRTSAKPTQQREAVRRGRPTYDRRNWVVGIAVGAALAVPVVGLMYWMLRPATLVLTWPLDERRGSQLLIDGEPEPFPRQDPFAVSIAPGKHRVVLRRRGYDPIEWNLNLSRGGRTEKAVVWEKTDISRPFSLGPSGK
ncbi:MAG TPA: serine/threonine-protein kinase [Pirellulales bacterium]|nr:serine/threonine-protein kinase [Pirellulales bacterium]